MLLMGIRNNINHTYVYLPNLNDISFLFISLHNNIVHYYLHHPIFQSNMAAMVPGMDKRTNALLKQVGDGILQQALAEEKELDAKLADMQELGEDDFETLRQKRRLELQKKVRQEQDWKQLGHGSYTEINDTKEFFYQCKKSERVVVHFYRPVTPRCQIVDAHFQKLAVNHLETRFLKIDAEKNPFLVEKLGIILMPTMVLIKNGKTDHAIHGFDEFGGTDDFTTEDVAFVLSQHGVLDHTGVDRDEDIADRHEKNMGFNNIKISNVRAGDHDLNFDDDELEW